MELAQVRRIGNVHAGRNAAADGETVRIPMRQSFIDELSVAGKELVSYFRHVTAKLNSLLSEENQQQLVRTLASLEAASVRVSTLARELEPGAKGVVALTDDARALLRRAGEMMSGIESLATELKSLTRSFERVAASAESVGTSTETVARSAIAETLPRINRLLDQLSRNSQRLDRLLAELDEHPSSLIFGRPPREPGPGEPGFTAPKAAKP